MIKSDADIALEEAKDALQRWYHALSEEVANSVDQVNPSIRDIMHAIELRLSHVRYGTDYEVLFGLLAGRVRINLGLARERLSSHVLGILIDRRRRS